MAHLKTATPSRESTAQSPAATQQPSHAAIEERAYHRYVERGRLNGFDVEDWLVAETDLCLTPEVLAQSI